MGDKEVDTLSRQLENSADAQAAYGEEVEALKGEIERKDNELSAVRLQLASLNREIQDRYRDELEGLRKKNARYTELEERFKSLQQHEAELREQLDTAFVVKVEIEKKLEHEERLRQAAQDQIAFLERKAAEKGALRPSAVSTGGTGVREGDGWWTEEVLMYRVKEGDTLARITAGTIAGGDDEQGRKVYSCNYNVIRESNELYPNQVLMIPSMAIVRAESGEGAPAEEEERWAIHIGSYLTGDEAEVVAGMVETAGDKAYITEHNEYGQHWYRVRVGFYPSEETAALYAKELSARLKIDDMWAVRPTDKEIMSNSGTVKEKKPLNNI